jgi:hypothetical protein
MKTRSLITLICGLLFIISVGTSSYAESDVDVSPRPKPHQPGDQPYETGLLQRLLQMEDNELAKLRQTIQRIEKMSAEEKAHLHERIGKMHEMDPKRIQAMREKYEAIPKEQREAMRQRWLAMTPQQRLEWRKKLKQMSPYERKAVFGELGFMPTPPDKGKKGPRPPHSDDQRPRVEREQTRPSGPKN